ncbi:MAG: hypothetical protein HY361_01525, partial [Candidatus Aenigmarchaeota archaeon]|nr:hypothetical protein [Candidatus Aenigmarchaeota archaeon]
GQHNLTLWANDTSGNMNSTTRRFSIDTIIPSIDITVPTNNTNSTNNRQNINATKSDLNRASCWYSNDSMLVNTTLASCANITTVTWSEGQHNVTMWVNDSAGNKNSSLVSFYLDSKSPALNVTYPINNTNWTNNLLMVNYTSSDINLQSCWYNNDSMLVNTTLTGCANITAVTWSEGQHNVTIYANDSLGNLNKSSVRFSIDSTGPGFTTFSNQSVSYNTSFSYTLAASDASGVQCYRVNDTSRFSLSCSGVLKNNTLLDVGLYWLNITANDTLGLETSAVMFVNVTLDPTISLTLITPTADINATQNQTFTVSVTVSCNYADCGQVNVSLDPEISDKVMDLNTEVITDDASSEPTAFLSSDLGSLASEQTDFEFLLSESTNQLSPEQKPEESGNSYTTLSAISLYDNKSFEYDIQDGCSILDGNTDVFDSGMVLKINTTAYTGTRSTTEDEGREAFCNAQNMSSMNVSRKVYVTALGNFSRYLEILHNPRQTEVCVNVQISSNMGSDGSDFLNTSDYNTSWKMLDHWMMWDDSTAGGGDSAAGFVYQQDGATETVDEFSPSTASGGANSYTWNNVCVPAGQTRIFMHFFTQMTSRVQAEIESDALYTAFSDSSHTTGMSTTEMSQVVNWALTVPQTKSGLVSMNTSATPFYTTTQNPYNITLTANETATITWTVNATGTMNQSYTFFVYANRTSNMSVSAITSQWNVTIINGSSLSAPSITIETPTNNSYTSTSQLNINYSVTYDTLSTCWYSNDSMLVNTTLTGCANITTVTWSEGQHNVTIYANDTSGNVGSSTVRFTLDRTYPSLTLLSPTNDSSSNNSGLDVLYSLSDTNLASCWYSNDSMLVNTTLTGCANITTVTWSEGQHNVTIYANDSAGNSNTTSVRFTIDSLNPAISVSSPTNDSSSNNSGLDV